MKKDPFTKRYDDLLTGLYDCPDRIVLNGYNCLLHQGGCFRNWWRLLFGDDSKLDKNHLMQFSGRASRRIKAYCAKNKIPLIFLKNEDKDTRAHQVAEEHMPSDVDVTGVFCITVKRAPGPVMKCSRNSNDKITNLATKISYVNHYSFHIMDDEWGHMTIILNPHPPFSIKICLNGHEYVERLARKKNIGFKKEDNCFTGSPNLAGLSRIAETMSADGAGGRLAEVCERWVYTSVLCFAFPRHWIEASNFQYQYSVYQVECSRNLLFKRGHVLDQVFESLIERTLPILDIKRLKTIFGYIHRPFIKEHTRGKKPRFEVTVEKPVYDLTIFKIHFNKLTVKIYSKGARVLRTEVIAHNTKALRTKRRSIEFFPAIIQELQGILVRFLQVIECIDRSCIDSGIIAGLALPGRLGSRRIGGVHIDSPRMRAVFSAVTTLSIQPQGFTASQVAKRVRDCLGIAPVKYSARMASYDICKLRTKKLVNKRKGTHHYCCSPRGLRTVAGILLLKDKVITPLLSNLGKTRKDGFPRRPSKVDSTYAEIQECSRKLLQHYGVAC